LEELVGADAELKRMRPFYPRACPVIRIDAIWLATEPTGMRDDTETAPVQ
jgi:hypothetical protein